MAPVLPLLLAGLAGFAIVVTLTALWQSLRNLMVDSVGDDAVAYTPTMAARARLEQEKNALLQAIRDVRFEQELGKLSPADCERLEAQYRTRAREVLAELDAQLAPYRQEARKRLALDPSSSDNSTEAAS